MREVIKCKICGVHRARRYCPGVLGDICPSCCGTEREMTIDCPLECEYLQQAREYERLPEPAPGAFPNQDIRFSDKFLLDHESLLELMTNAIFEAAIETPGAIDLDVRDALESLIRTYRTLVNGLYYESLPANLLAAKIHQSVQESMTEVRETLKRRSSVGAVRDSDMLLILVFLQRLELRYNNGRKRGRAFLSFMREHFALTAPPMEEEPRLIL